MWERKNWTPAKTGMDFLYRRIKNSKKLSCCQKRSRAGRKIKGERKCESDSVQHPCRPCPWTKTQETDPESTGLFGAKRAAQKFGCVCIFQYNHPESQSLGSL